MTFTRITINAAQMDGVACVRGLRIPVTTIVGLLADGMSEPDVLAAYPDLTADDIDEAVRFAALPGPLSSAG